MVTLSGAAGGHVWQPGAEEVTAADAPALMCGCHANLVHEELRRLVGMDVVNPRRDADHGGAVEGDRQVVAGVGGKP